MRFQQCRVLANTLGLCFIYFFNFKFFIFQYLVLSSHTVNSGWCNGSGTRTTFGKTMK